MWIFAIGFLAQLLFGSRMLIQWIQSEKAGKSLSLTIFWQLSIIGSVIFLIYGILRKDISIVIGQSLVYYIYIRNLHLKQHWLQIPKWFRWLVLIIPVLMLGYLFSGFPGNLAEISSYKEIPFWLKVLGTTGQIVFTLRFFVQLIDSETIKQSIFTERFWMISMVGAVLIIIYSLYRRDPVLLIGQAGGTIVYIRNLMIINRKSLDSKTSRQ